MAQDEGMNLADEESVVVPIPSRMDGDALAACVSAARQLVEDAAKSMSLGVGLSGSSGGQAVFRRCAKVCMSERMSAPPPEDAPCEMAFDAGAELPSPRRRRPHAEMFIEPTKHAPPNLHAAVLSFSARLLMYVNEKYDGVAPMAYRRAGVSRQIYSRIVSSDDSKVDKRTAMCFCIGLQLEMREAELLMKSAGYAFSGTLPEDRVFNYCIENRVWNLRDVNDILLKCGLRPMTRSKDPYKV